MNKNIISIILILLVVAVVGYFFLNNNADEDSVEITDGTTSLLVPAPGFEDVPEMIVITVPTVTYTSDGFSPKTITIKQGEEVRFVNESGTEMWVASNIHPTHTLYKGFDQLGRDTTYEFTFEREGAWGYHNHLLPNSTGTIIVE